MPSRSRAGTRLASTVAALVLGLGVAAPVVAAAPRGLAVSSAPASSSPIFPILAATVQGTHAKAGAVACADATSCETVGSTTDTDRGVNPYGIGVVMPFINGLPGTVQTVPDTVSLSDVACPSTTFCVAVGLDSVGYPTSVTYGVVVSITNGVAAAPQAIAGTFELNSVACLSVTTCYVVGDNRDGLYPNEVFHGVMIPVVDGTPGLVQPVLGTRFLHSVACSATSTCYAVGDRQLTAGTFHDVVVPITLGIAVVGQDIVGTDGVDKITCPGATACVAVGYSAPAPLIHGVVVPITNGIPGAAHPVPGAGWLGQVACPTPTTCVASGFTGLTNNVTQGVVVPIADGVPGAAQPVVGTRIPAGLVCPSVTTCWGTADNAAFQGEAVTITVPLARAGTFTYPLDGQATIDTTRSFAWSTVPGAQAYDLVVGTSAYGVDLVSSGLLPPTRSTFDVPALPVGVPLYATMLTEVDGTWSYQPVSFTAAPGQAAFASPLNEQTAVDPTRALTWSTIPQAQGYYVIVGTSQYLADVNNSGALPPTQASFTPPVLSALKLFAGQRLYATVFTKVNGAYSRYQAVSYTVGPAFATFIHPVNAQLNVATPTTFTWTTIAAAQAYEIWLGTQTYGSRLFNSGLLAKSSFNGPSLPHGATLYATLLTLVNGNWYAQVAQFTTA